MKFLLDMNIASDWVSSFQEAGFEARHWSEVGDVRASDKEIFGWAADHDFVVVTYDLDFSELLALSKSSAPSVVQIRVADLLSGVEQLVIAAIRQFQEELSKGALISIAADRTRVRLLPFQQPE